MHGQQNVKKSRNMLCIRKRLIYLICMVVFRRIINTFWRNTQQDVVTQDCLSSTLIFVSRNNLDIHSDRTRLKHYFRLHKKRNPLFENVNGITLSSIRRSTVQRRISGCVGRSCRTCSLQTVSFIRGC